MSKPTIKDTKQTILDAYNAAITKLQQLESGKMNPQAELKAKETAAVIASADEVSIGGIIENKVAGLKKELGLVLDGIAGDISEQLKKYSDVQDAIIAKEHRLQELFGLETEAFALVALINAKEEIARQYDDAFAQKKDEREKELQTIQDQAREARQSLTKELNEANAKIAQDRVREQEEYLYNTERKRKQETDAFNDELEAKKREFNEKCDAFTKTLNAREESIMELEDSVAEREAKIDDLEEAVASLEASKETAVQEALKKGKSDASSEYYREKAYIEREAKHQVELAESKVATLQEALDKANATNEALTDKLERAYAEVREIAKSTIDNAGNKQVINQLERLVQSQQTIK
jgi:hypothetical protein